ncbi:hypothetical protein MICAF_1380011 [Microcystis aeruginosa PCC 9807]|uniref:S-adenosyl-l-methionine hydroxide adenosyltransferase N-terminal domain-containing protein n=1 Tax=Microcystis aeruginosa PCC 9807 TaxID=1160283 RepID=I4H0G8_MICAE|nr:hypothetical protein MICAF_1380011 [Microcystis aeruginosa PCC 9807]
MALRFINGVGNPRNKSITEQALITLTSDFGLQDGYVGIIKGVIAGIAPHARTIDLNHQISPQDLYAGRFVLLNAYQYFPQGTIHQKFWV